MMTIVSVHEAKTHLSRLINDVLAGKEVIVRRGKEEVVKLVPLNRDPQTRRTPGRFAKTPGARGILDHGFWEPLDDVDIGIDDDSDQLV